MRDHRAAAERDAGLVRLRRATRWVTAGALGLAGGFSLLVAQALPGHSSPATSPPQPAGTSTRAPTTTAGSSPALQPPTQAPTPTQAPAPVVSGGS
ncbi:MAG TPA: hypothetical protein VE152_13000 [Acidimicrobiales bacterium]|nr:hypothetical protein [Acidimicrobiales bacterium]